jgi:hypothetical protein
MSPERRVEPEWLDLLPADHPGAVRSRRDIGRLNFLMNNAGILARGLAQHIPSGDVRVLADLGASDGRMALRLARRLSPRWGPVQTLLIDRKEAASDTACRQLHALGWSADIIVADVFDWLRDTPPVDVIVANLFLHHFQQEGLTQLLFHISRKTGFFIACEPRRSPLAWHGCRLLGLLGCNYVTRHDSIVSVQAGFQANELSDAWPDGGDWQLLERAALPFNHCFIARRIQRN